MDWQQLCARRVQRRRGLLAASIAAVAVVGVVIYRVAAPISVGAVEFARGTAMLERESGDMALRDGAALHVGDVLSVGGDGLVVLRRADGSRMALAAATKAVWRGRDVLGLARGRLYHDTDAADSARPLAIDTTFGRVQHLGTRYLVSVDYAHLSVLVRSGTVRFDLADVHHAVERGQRMMVDAAGRLSVAPADNTGADWAWIDALDAKLVVDGQSLHAVLQQIAERAGLQLIFAQPAAAERARSVILRGPPIELSPVAAAQAVLATTTLRLRLDQNRMIISVDH
jgi:ferric-dicitrate binding protein FerR (iron transport regulator)